MLIWAGCSAYNDVMRLRFGGLLIPCFGWPEALGRATELEQAGFDAVVVDDHLVNPADPQGPWSECWSLLAALAAKTTRIALGPLVSNTILRPPAVLARQALTVDEISGGRLELAIGAGYAPTDYRGAGRSVPAVNERREQFAAALGIVTEHLDNAAANGRRHIPITVAAHDRSSLDLAARFADRWVSYGAWGKTLDELVDLTRRRGEWLDERCAELGRAAPPSRSVLIGSAAVCRDPLWTSVDAFEDAIGRFANVGIDTFYVYWPPTVVSRAVDQTVVDTVLAEVIPRLRAAA